MSNFEIVRRSPREHRNLTSPVVASAIGIAFQESATAGLAELSDGIKPLAGFATRAVVVGGPTLADNVFAGRLELPFTAGKEISLEHGEEIEFEGAGYIAASGGGGAITSATALESDLSFVGGKVCVRDAGTQLAFYRLKEIMTPETPGALRIRVAQIAL
jgi:hypothetical protein